MTSPPTLTLVPGLPTPPAPPAEPQGPPPTAELAADIAHGVVSLAAGPGGAGADSLAWPLGLNAYMHRHGASPADVLEALAALRSAVLAVSGLDAAAEPVPLPVSDLAVQAVNAAVYLAGLVARAARAADRSATSVVEDALARLVVAEPLSA